MEKIMLRKISENVLQNFMKGLKILPDKMAKLLLHQCFLKGGEDGFHN